MFLKIITRRGGNGRTLRRDESRGKPSEGYSPTLTKNRIPIEFSCCGGNGRTLQQDREPGIIHLVG